jgi:hypothetical protein
MNYDSELGERPGDPVVKKQSPPSLDTEVWSRLISYFNRNFEWFEKLTYRKLRVLFSSENLKRTLDASDVLAKSGSESRIV